MRKLFFAAVGLVAFGAMSSAANATVVVRVSKSRQMMYVYVDGYLEHAWPVSTGRGRYRTPGGVYRPTSLSPFHRSSRYHNAPMPHSIFFRGGYAIHGSYDVGNLGRPASHGCIRLHPYNASELYGLVRSYGSGGTRIVVSQ